MALVRKSADPRGLIQNCLNQDGYQTPLRVPLLGLQDSDPPFRPPLLGLQDSLSDPIEVPPPLKPAGLSDPMVPF